MLGRTLRRCFGPGPLMETYLGAATASVSDREAYRTVAPQKTAKDVRPSTLQGPMSPFFDGRRDKADTTLDQEALTHVPLKPLPSQLTATRANVNATFALGQPLEDEVSVDEFPPGWLRLTAELQAKAQLGSGLHDDNRLGEAQRSKTKTRSVTVGGIDPLTTSDAGASLEGGDLEQRTAKFQQTHQPFSTVSPLAPSMSPAVAEYIDATKNTSSCNDAETPPSPTQGEDAGDANRIADASQATSPFPLAAVKTFEMGDFGGVYKWFGTVMGLARELGVVPVVDMFYCEVTLTVPLTEAGRRLAMFANLYELRVGMRRNFSDGIGTMDGEGVLGVPPEVLERVEDRTDTTFCWVLKSDKTDRDIFMSEIFLQWYHRADYLMRRKSKEKKEYRENLTLEQVLKSASQNRRRRVEKREERERLREEAMKTPSPPALRAARKRAYAEMNTTRQVGRKINQALGAPKHHIFSQVETSKARGTALPRASQKVIGTPSMGGSCGDIADLTYADDDSEVDADDLDDVEAAKEDSMSFASRFAKQKELKERRGKKTQGTPPVMEVLPREMREQMDKEFQYDEGTYDIRMRAGNVQRGTNRPMW